MTESPSDADIIADGRVFALNCEYAHGRCTRLDFSPGNLVAFVRSLLAAKQPEPPLPEMKRCPSCNGVGSTGPIGACRTCGGMGFVIEKRLAAPPAGPTSEPAGWIESPHGQIRANPAYRFTGPQTLAWSIPLYAPALAAQPSPEGGEAEREALTLALRALEDAGSMWMKSGDVGRRLAAIDAIHAALSRKETPHASD